MLSQLETLLTNGIDDKPSTSGTASPVQNGPLNPEDISLNDLDVSGTFKRRNYSIKKDPDTGLTIDTVMRRNLCKRYTNMVNVNGVVHRIPQLTELTEIQVAGLLRRSRNKPELSDVSDDVWNCIFEEKRREDRSDKLSPSKSKAVKDKRDLSKLPLLTIDTDEGEDSDITEDEDENKDVPTENIFEEVSDPNPGAHNLLDEMGSYYSDRRDLMHMSELLKILSRMYREQRRKLVSVEEQLRVDGPLRFEETHFKEGDDPTERCARLRPIKGTYRAKVYNVNDNSESKLRGDEFARVGKLMDVAENGVDELVADVVDKLRFDLQEEENRPAKPNRNRDLVLDKRRLVKAHNKQRLISTNRHTNGIRSRRRRQHIIQQRRSVQIERPLESFEEHTSDLRVFEEHLHRLSSGYVYSEITVPEFREFDLSAHQEKAAERLCRKISSDVAMVDETSNHSAETDPWSLEDNEALIFADVHHAMQFPILSEDQLRERRKLKWLPPVPEFVPYCPNKYRHEDPRLKSLFSCVIKTSEPPYESLFHPGIDVEICPEMHRESLTEKTKPRRRGRPRMSSSRVVSSDNVAEALSPATTVCGP